MQEAETVENPPKDRYKAVYLILLLQGVGILMPWNMFITARSYFVDYKMSKNYTGEDTDYATYFVHSVAFASQIPNIIFNWANVFINIRGSVTPRVLLAISVEIVIIIVTIILAFANSSGWPAAFFWTTLVTIVILNMTNGIYQNTIFGISAKLPSKYPGSVLLGSNVSGTLVSIIQLITNAAAPSVKTASIYYFTAALFVLMICLVMYFVLLKSKFYRYYELSSLKQPSGTDSAETIRKIPYLQIFKSAFRQLFNLFFVFFVTISIFPALQANIKKSDSSFVIPEKYYIDVMCFLTFNTMALLGCLLSNWINWPSPKLLLIPVLLRALFIPFFFFCNYQPTNMVRKVPVLIPNDWAYWVAAILMAFTSGYLSMKAIIYISAYYSIRSVEAVYASISGMFGAAVLVTGIFCGALFSLIFPCLAEV